MGSQRYEYDSLSRLVTLNGGYERYLYDGAGERVARITAPTPGSSFFTITPCRLLDTRNPPPNPPVPLDPANPRTVQVTGNCGIPAEASGVAGNLTAVTPPAPGYLQLSPAGATTDVSTLNYRPGLTRANNFNLGLSGAGQLTLSTFGTSTHALIDLSGYYAFPSSPTSPIVWTLTFRDESSRLSTDYSVGTSISRSKNYFYFGNLLVATRDSAGAYRYYSSDHLGTPRLVTNSANPPQVVETHKYQPFGQEIGGTFGAQPLKFAAMERDASSGKDYDHARFLSSIEGRFLSPDKLHGKVVEPQTWNRYSYANNNPVKLVDPNGLCSAPAGVGNGNVGVCIEAFIAANRIRGGLALGDARGFSGTDPSLTSRVQIQMLMNTQTGKISSTVETGTSYLLFKSPVTGSKGTTVSSVGSVPTGNGGTSVSVGAYSWNGFAGAPGAPSSPIQFNVGLDVDASGKVTVDPSATQAKTYPSFAGYAYGPDGSVTTLFEQPENKIGDLNKPMQPLKPESYLSCVNGTMVGPCPH